MFEKLAAKPDNNQLTKAQEMASMNMLVECWPGGPIVSSPAECPPPSERFLGLPDLQLFDSKQA